MQENSVRTLTLFIRNTTISVEPLHGYACVQPPPGYDFLNISSFVLFHSFCVQGYGSAEIYDCKNCGKKMNRDINGVKNIYKLKVHPPYAG